MPRLRAAIVVLVAGAVAALALAACGGGADLLAGETADEIKENLDLIERSAEEGDCTEAEGATADVKEQVEKLQVDSRLRSALEEGVGRLSEKVLIECREGEEEETTTEAPETTEEEVEPEEEEREQKPGKEKQQPDETEPEEREEEPEGEEEETTEPPTEPEESSSGGVGPGAPAEGE
jgi:outer membrane biosynthesis protein TonB